MAKKDDITRRVYEASPHQLTRLLDETLPNNEPNFLKIYSEFRKNLDSGHYAEARNQLEIYNSTVKLRRKSPVYADLCFLLGAMHQLFELKKPETPEAKRRQLPSEKEMISAAKHLVKKISKAR